MRYANVARSAALQDYVPVRRKLEKLSSGKLAEAIKIKLSLVLSSSHSAGRRGRGRKAEAHFFASLYQSFSLSFSLFQWLFFRHFSFFLLVSLALSLLNCESFFLLSHFTSVPSVLIANTEIFKSYTSAHLGPTSFFPCKTKWLEEFEFCSLKLLL